MTQPLFQKNEQIYLEIWAIAHLQNKYKRGHFFAGHQSLTRFHRQHMSRVQYPISERRPLLSYAPHNRAFLIDDDDDDNYNDDADNPFPKSDYPMPPSKRSKSRGRRQSKGRGGSTKVRLVKGRVLLRVSGYSGVQSLAPSHLVRHIPGAKLRLAAKKLLNLSDNKKQSGGGRRGGPGKRKTKKSKKGKKKGKRKAARRGKKKKSN